MALLSSDSGHAALADRLSEIRGKVNELEDRLVADLNTQKAAKSALKRVQTLISLQGQEAKLAQQRIREIELTVKELEERRSALIAHIRAEQRQIREGLVELHRSLGEPARGLDGLDREVVEAPRRKILGRLAERGMRELEAYRVDLADAEELALKIAEEKNQLAFLVADLSEREEVLKFNQDLQLDLIQRKRSERLRQLEAYRRLKESENNVERMLGDFNARRELQRTLDVEKEARRAMNRGEFARLQGKLNWPVSAHRVLGRFGRQLDEASGLQVFRKGIEIGAPSDTDVKSVSAGKVAYAGEMAGYGRIVIIDHGDHFYSLLGRLGEITLTTGSPVRQGDVIGRVASNARSVYFEIRSRTVAVDPLQWLVQ